MATDNGPTILVCTRADEPSPWKSTNLFGVCEWCNAAIQYRPHAPTNIVRVCVECYAARRTEDDSIVVTERSIAELAAYRRRH